MVEKEDPIGFTKRTELVLRGIGAAALIPECKRRNISTRTLHDLTLPDLIRLGANVEEAEEMKKSLEVMSQRTGSCILSLQERIERCLEIVKVNETHLETILALLAYNRLRLTREKINIFVEPEKCICAADILPLAVDATLAEVGELDVILCELNKLISTIRGKPQNSHWRGFVVLGVVAFAGLVTLRIYWK